MFKKFSWFIVVILIISITGAEIMAQNKKNRKKKPKKPRVKKELVPATEEEIKFIQDAAPAKATVTVKTPRNILVFYLCEGFQHGAILKGNKAFEIIGKKTGAYNVVESKDKTLFTTEKLKEFDAVLLNNTTKLQFDDNQKKALLNFVKGGKGLIGIHAASDNFKDWPEGAEMVGGLFDGHPWGAKGKWCYKPTENNHPLNKAFNGQGFCFKDEIYQIKDPYSRKRSRILVTLDMSKEENKKIDEKKVKRTDNDFAISWIHKFGKGRVFYCSFGHNNEVFWNKQVLQHYLDGIQYALGDLKADDTPSEK